MEPFRSPYRWRLVDAEAGASIAEVKERIRSEISAAAALFAEAQAEHRPLMRTDGLRFG